MPNSSPLRVVNWNGRSIQNKQLEFFDFLQSHNIDVAVVTETWLRPNISFLHPNYCCIRFDRGTNNDADRGGGVLIAIRREIGFQELRTKSKVIETVGISIPFGEHKLNIIAAYFPGSRRGSDWSSFRQDIRALSNHTDPFLIVGDFNARHNQWNCATNNRAGNLLLQEATHCGFTVHYPDTPTFLSHGRGRPSTLDLVLSNNILNMTKPVTLNELSSDHLPVSFEVTLTEFTEEQINTFRCYSRDNWITFQRVMNAKINLTDPRICNINTENEVDAALTHLKNAITEAEAAAVPVAVYQPYEVARISDETQQLIRLRNCRRRQWMRTRDPILKEIVSSLNERIRYDCTRTRFSKFQSTLLSLERGDNKIWRITKALKNHCKYSPPLRSGEFLIASPAEKANLLASNFEKSHDNQLADDPITAAIVQDSIVQIDQSAVPTDNSWLVQPKEVDKIIRKLKPRKAPGIDKIRNCLLKKLPRKARVFISKLFSACIKLCYFPQEWKHAVIVAIPKPNKDATLPSNYRPISLLSSISKLFERIILTRIESHLDTNRIIPYEQFGFQKGHSTNHQTARLVKEVRQRFEEGYSTGLILLDVEKAYDSVWHDAVLYKMLQANFPVRIIKIIRSFLKDRTFEVSVKGCSSEHKRVPFGVPQGSVLSPTLYNIFSADIVKVDGVQYYFFADDTGFLASHREPQEIIEKLQRAQNAILEYQRKWKIKTNPAKCQAIFFTRRRSPRYMPQNEITCGDIDIPWSESSVYLGLTLDKKLTFGLHTNNCIKKFNKLTRALYPLVKRRSRLDKNIKLLLYKTVFRPTITYGFPAWYNCAQSHRNKIQVKQNRLLKMILDLEPSHPTVDVHRIAGVEQLNDWFTRLLPKFNLSCSSSTNPLLQELAV